MPTDLNRMARGGRARRRTDLVDRVRAQRRSPAAAAAPLRLVGGRGRLDPARHAASRSGSVRSVAVTPESATSVVLTKVLMPRAEILPIERLDEADAKLLIGDAALQSAFEDPTPHHDLGPAVARAHGAADGVRRVGGAASRSSTASPTCRTRSSRPSASRARSPSVLAYEASERYGYPAGLPRAVLREAPLQLRPEGARRAATRSSRWPATSASSTTSRSSASSPRRRSRRERDARADDCEPGQRASSRRRSTGSASATTTRSRCCARATSSRSVGSRTRSATARSTRPGSPSSSTGTSTTRTSASPTATSARSTARPATPVRRTCCRSR